MKAGVGVEAYILEVVRVERDRIAASACLLFEYETQQLRAQTAALKLGRDAHHVHVPVRRAACDVALELGVLGTQPHEPTRRRETVSQREADETRAQ